jgi:hypothetical protein
MKKATSANIPANSFGKVTQDIRVVNSNDSKPIKMKIKITYTKVNGQVVEIDDVISEFPKFL